MTQNNIATRFTHQKVFLLRKNYFEYKPEYILFDLRPGQNLNAFFSDTNPKRIFNLIKTDACYQMIYQTDYQFLFKREAQGKICRQIVDGFDIN